jgi:hypothetical protein
LVAAGLTLLLFAIMSLVVLRQESTPAAIGPLTETPVKTPGLSAAGAEDMTPLPPVVPTPGEDVPAAATAMIGLWLSALSAITALVGLVSSLWLGWRKERREVAQHRLELERTQLEVEKLRRELGRNGNEEGNTDVTSVA